MKLILANMIGWRCGSSMLVGLLHKMGAAVGEYNDNAGQKSLNSYGSFENKCLVPFQQKLLKPHWLPPNPPMDIEELVKKSEERMEEIEDICAKQFGASEYAAVKSLSCSLVPALMKSQKVTPYVIRLTRDVNKQANSMCAVMGMKNRKPIIDWLNVYEEWRDAVLHRVGANYIGIRFGDLLRKPIATVRAICEFTGMEYPGDNVVTSWVHPEFSRYEAAA